MRDIDIHDVPTVSYADNSAALPSHILILLCVRYSGKDREPAYVPPSTPLEHNLAVPEGKKLYEGSCHCQTVRFAVVHDPLEKSEANDCNCTLCGGVSCLAFPVK